MTIFKDVIVWFNAMGTLPWNIRVWACLYPLPQVLGGLFFVQTLPGFVILAGRILSGIVASQVHKRSPFSKLMGPVGHAHWLIIIPYLVYELATQDLTAPLYWFVSYVVGTTLVSGVIDVREVMTYLKRGHVKFQR
ncbi:MAG: hypothetical protein GY947_01440 [Rhodobacteraceae bacterium]|nr:hypothetical protein [Paracoccaceae bacterium]